MKCLQVDSKEGSVDILQYTYQLRTGILLAQTTIIVGNTGFLIFFEAYFNSLSHIRQVKLMDGANQDAAQESKDCVANYLKITKDFAKIKHPPNNHLIAVKKMERTMVLIVNEWKNEVLKNIDLLGLKDLYSFYKKGVFEPLAYALTGETESDVFLPRLKVITHKSPINFSQKVLWLMPSQFYSNSIFTQAAHSTLPLNDDVPYFIKAFTLPNINLLSIAELNSIRNQLSSLLIQFNEAVDEWATACYLNEGKNIFENKVIPLLPEVNEIIENNLLLKHLNNIHQHQSTHTIFLGEVDKTTFLKWHLQQKIIDNDEYENILEENKNSTQHTVPIMLFLNQEHLVFEDEENQKQTEEIEIANVKKYITVD